MQVDVSKSCQETDLIDLEVLTDENFVAASWAVGGRAQESSLRLFYICLLERPRNPWELRSWRLRFFRWSIRALASEFGGMCVSVVCVSRNLEEAEISNSFIAVFRFSRCLFRFFISTEIGYKTSFQLLLLWKLEENSISQFWWSYFSVLKCYFPLILFFSMKSSVISIYSWVR